ncbi:hypothetical protein LQF12_04415 [Ruania suaedae]|uniref:hypothetical protein n=1 Tax=Ruania suaedae TaxID=2897774 RepID=UPI001E436B22|nr:hypothetical protein [Ruania suaedae]UFU03858.1 hypothetical protein LQF12_04415 [Ruania suaedae]
MSTDRVTSTDQSTEQPTDQFAQQPADHQPVQEAETMSSTTAPMQYDGAQAPSTPAPREGTRLRTVVWGLVLILLGGVVIAIGLGARLDPATVVIGILGIAGATLLLGALVSAARGRRSPGADV